VKFKTTLILAAVFAVLLVFVLFIEKKPKEAGSGPEEKLVALTASDVESATVKTGTETLSLRKDEKGEWMIAEPVEAKADASAVDSLISALADLRIERVVEAAGDPKKYDIPQREASLKVKGQTDPVRILFGPENKIDGTLYAQKAGDPRIVLVPSSLKSQLDKKTLDFRQKDVFRFDPKDVAGIKLAAKTVKWEAGKTDGEWFLTAPFKALAKESLVTGLLDSLAGLRAKEFAAEAKSPKELKDLGLAEPEYTVTLNLPGASKEIVFALHKAADKTYATTSQSTKIIVPETDILPDLEKAPADLREKKVAVFSSWQADRLAFKRGGISLTVHKAANDKWYFDDAEKEEADGTKISAFLGKVEGLEASEFVDAPKGPAEYGLDKPAAELTIRTKDTLGEKPVEKTVTLAVGKVDAEKKQAAIKNARFAWLFRAEAAFLDDLPKEKKDWLAPAPAAPEKK